MRNNKTFSNYKVLFRHFKCIVGISAIRTLDNFVNKHLDQEHIWIAIDANNQMYAYSSEPEFECVDGFWFAGSANSVYLGYQSTFDEGDDPSKAIAKIHTKLFEQWIEDHDYRNHEQWLTDTNEYGLVLNSEDALAFVSAFERPMQTNHRFLKAARKYKETITNENDLVLNSEGVIL